MRLTYILRAISANQGEKKLAVDMNQDAERATADRIATVTAEADRAEADRIAAVRAETDRMEVDRIAAVRAEADRMEVDRIAAVRAEADRVEADRIAAVRAEADRIIVAVKADADRIAAVRVEAERVETDRIAAVKAEADRIIVAVRAEADRIAAVRAEADRITDIRAEAERVETAMIAAVKAEADRIAVVRATADKAEADRIVAVRAEAERAEADRNAVVKVEAERAEFDRIAAVRAAAERAEADRIAVIRAEADRAEANRIAAVRATADRAEADRIAAVRVEADKIIAAVVAEAERAEANRVAAVRAEAERAEADRVKAVIAVPVVASPVPPPDTHVVALVEEAAVKTEAVRAEAVATTIIETTTVAPDNSSHSNVLPNLSGQKENENRDVTDTLLTRRWTGLNEADALPRRLFALDALWARMWTGLNEYQQSLCRKEKSMDLVAAITAIAEMILTSLIADNTLIRMLFAKKRSDDLTSHQLDMAVVSTKMGIVLGYDHDCLRSLTLCAMLHDIGMLKVSSDVLMKKGDLSKNDMAEIRKHPLYSYEILNDSGLPTVVAEVARQVHERVDGSGYPQGLQGDKIHEYASIISLADTFTAMLQPRPQRERKIPFEIVKEIIEREQGQLSRRLMKVLIDEFAIFPIGLYVHLNTGEIALVKKANKLAPLRPEVTVLTDARGRQLTEPKEYNLMREPLLTVVDSSFDQEYKSIDKPEKELEESAT